MAERSTFFLPSFFAPARRGGQGAESRAGAPYWCGTSVGPLPGHVSLRELLNLAIFSFLIAKTEVTLALTSKGSWED